MKKIKTFSFVKHLMAIIFALFFFTNINGQTLSNDYVVGEIIIQLNFDITPSQLTQAFGNIGLSQKQKISDTLNIWLFQYNTGSIQPDVCLNLLNENNLVKTAQFNHYVYLNSIPNDPGFSNQYGMNKIQAPSAWDFTTGGATVQNDQIIIAVLDVGFDINHPDIDFWKNTAEISGNGIDDDGNGYIDDYDGWNSYNNNGTITSADHGTHVAGIAGARGNNNLGVTGVNWNVKIMPVQVSSSTEAVVLAGYSYVLKMRELYNQTNGTEGAFVVVTNASFSTHGGDPVNYPLWCGIYDALGKEGVLSVNAPWNLNSELGNDFTDVPGMCSSQYLIVVTNTDQNDELSGDAPWSRTYIDMAAPGTDIYSTLPGSSYGYLTGTSMAAPHVAGAIALMYASACNELILNYKATPSSVTLSIKQILLNWSDPIVYPMPLEIGYGRLNIYRSIIKMSEQYDHDLYVTGTETTSEQYGAINDILVENYTGSDNFNVVFHAGHSISLKPNTSIYSVTHFFIDPASFNCAIPIQPLTVDLIAPEFHVCSPSLVSCNANVTGGVPPYNFVWSTKSVTDNNWTAWTLNDPGAIFLRSEDFYIKVDVTDDRGVASTSAVKLVDCMNAKTSFSDNESLIDSVEAEFADSSDSELNHKFIAYPNPFNNSVIIEYHILHPQDVTLYVTDITGKQIASFWNKTYHEKGNYKIELNFDKIAAGAYFCTLIRGNAIEVKKLIKISD